MKLSRKQKRITAAVIIGVLVIGGLFLLLRPKEETLVTGEAGLSDLLASRSERKQGASTMVVNGECPYYSMVSTPVAQYYDNDRNLENRPLLVYRDQPDMKTNPANDFLDHYSYERIVAVGGPSGVSHDADVRYPGDIRAVSMDIARDHWKSSDGAVLVDYSREPYGDTLYAALLASYVNIPIIVADDLDSRVIGLLDDLGVKYTILCGDMDGYGRVMRMDDHEWARRLTVDFISHPEGFGTAPRYITMANPLDGFAPEVDIVDDQHYSGSVYHIYTPGPGAYAGLEEASEGVDFDYNVPDSVENGLLKFEMSFKPHEQDEIDGERVYCFVFYEDPESGSWEEKYYMGTCAGVKDGAYETVRFEVPVLGATGNYRFHVEGRNTYEIGSGGLVTKKEVPFDLHVILESLDSPLYASMPMLSAVAPHQCAHHKGVLMAEEGYAMHYPQKDNCTGAFEPSVFEKSHNYVNSQAAKVKEDELALLSYMTGTGDGKEGEEDIGGGQMSAEKLADILYEDPVSVCIVGDTNMIPHYYHESGSSPAEGLGQAGDIIYADVDMDLNDPRSDLGDGVISPSVQDYELPIGRFAGYDVMDVSAQVARTFFYGDVIDDYVGHGQDPDKEWKDNGYVFLGSKMPVETMYGTYVRVVSEYFNDAEMDTIGTTEERSDYKLAHQFQEGSNYIMGGVHGNFYWYVPQCHINTISGGSAYDVTNVLEMSMGPSAMFLVSCITGRIDGLAPENCLSMAYIHVGVTSYVGATRSTLGFVDPGLEFDMRPFEPEGAVLLSEMYTSNLLSDQTAGLALRDAKNTYLVEDLQSGGIRDESFIMVQHYVLYGDPDFDPFEPGDQTIGA